MSHQPGNPQEPSQRQYYDRYIQQETTPPSGGGNRTPWLIGGAAAAVVVLAVAGFLMFGGGSGDTAGPSESSTTPTQQTPQTGSGQGSGQSSSQSVSVSSTTNPYGPALQSGWTTVVGASPRYPAAYDVPAGWQVLSKDTTYGYDRDNADGKGFFAHHVSTWKKGFCKTSTVQSKAFVGLADIGTRDLGEAVPDLAGIGAKDVAVKSDGQSYADTGTVTSKTISVGPTKEAAVLSTVTVEGGTPDVKKCTSKRVEIRVVGIKSASKSVALMLARDLDGSDVVPPATFDQIIASFRSKA